MLDAAPAQVPADSGGSCSLSRESRNGGRQQSYEEMVMRDPESCDVTLRTVFAIKIQVEEGAKNVCRSQKERVSSDLAENT